MHSQLSETCEVSGTVSVTYEPSKKKREKKGSFCYYEAVTQTALGPPCLDLLAPGKNPRPQPAL